MAKDPYKYFRIEARELIEGLSQGVLELEKGAPPEEIVRRLLRLAHTLKGAARVVKQPKIAELAHAVEDHLAVMRDSGRGLAPHEASELLGLIDTMSTAVRALDEAPVAGQPVRSASDDTLDTVRVAIGEMDALLHRVTDSAAQLGAMHAAVANVQRLRDTSRSLVGKLSTPGAVALATTLAEDVSSGLDEQLRRMTADIERLEASLRDVEDLTQRLRLIPAHTIFPLLERTVRDAAEAVGKPVDFEASGGEVRLDAHVLASLRDALMHVARNAVAHGIETSSERAAAGKPARGRVRLNVGRNGGRVSFACDDDGRGVDVEAVRANAVNRGLISAAEASSAKADDVVGLLGRGGLSTSTSLTELSGRGVGLDVVRSTVMKLNGDWSIRSTPGRGASVAVSVPVSIASLQGLLVEVAGSAVAVPLDAVRQTVRIDTAQIARSATGDAIVHDGKVIPFMPLEGVLGRGVGRIAKRRAWSAVIVEADKRDVAVGVDRLLGTANVVVRSLSPVVSAAPVVAGACLDTNGNPQLVLDPRALVSAVAKQAQRLPEEAPAAPLPILVVDDSLTTRMLEQSILESAGYAVELATSAEEGLMKARERRYSLVVVDVEMPGMDGFGFVSTVRADPTLRDIPCILVTSRNAVEDRRRGEQVGARAYIVKGEFDQGLLLKTIRRLIG